MSKKLNKCPFCSSPPAIKHGTYKPLGSFGPEGSERTWFAVYCRNCGVSQPARKYHSREEAEGNWNRRR